jgi:hypothetical protein
MPTNTLLCSRCWGDAPQNGEACPTIGCGATDGWIELPAAFRGIYELRERAARDATVGVFRAVDTRGGSPVTIKVQRRDGPRDVVRGRLEAITTEQAALVALGDTDQAEPSFPQLLGMERTEPAYLAIERIELPTLEQLVALRPLSPIDTAWMGIALLRCVQLVATSRFLHEGLLPGNVLVREGDWHVVFGDLAACRAVSAPGAAVELPEPGAGRVVSAFAAPVPLDGDPRAGDVHVASQLLWFAATGAAPFAETDGQARRIALATVPARPDAMPLALYEVLAGGMAPSAEDRPTTVGLSEALAAFARAVIREERLTDLRDRATAAVSEVAPLAGLPALVSDVEHSLASIVALASEGRQAEFDAACDAAMDKLRALDTNLADTRAAESPRLAAVTAERDAALARAAELDAARIAIGAALAEEEAKLAELSAQVAQSQSVSTNVGREALAALELERERVLVLDAENRRLASALDAARVHPLDSEPTVEIGAGTAHAVTLASLEEARAALGVERARAAAMQAERDEAGARLAAEVRRSSAARVPPPAMNPWPLVFAALFVGLLAGAIGGKLYGDMGRSRAHVAAAPAAQQVTTKGTSAVAAPPVAAPAVATPAVTPAPTAAVVAPTAAVVAPDAAVAAPAKTTAPAPSAAVVAPAKTTAPAAATAEKPAASAKALVKSGWAAAEKSDFGGAISLFDQAVKAGGGADARFGRGYARENVGDVAGAVIDYCASLNGANAERKREVEGILSRLGRTCN